MADFIYHTAMLICCVLIAIFSFLMLFDAIGANAAEVELPVRVKIINLTDRPLDEAIAYCDEHNLACPELRAKYDPVSGVEFEPLPQDLNDIEPAAGYVIYE